MFTILGADGKEYGPVTAANVIEWIRDGRANLQTRVKLGRDGEWKSLGDFPEFGGRPAATALPPPLLTGQPFKPTLPGTATMTELADRGQRFCAALVDGLLEAVCMLPITVPLYRAFAQTAGGGPQSFSESYRITQQILTENFDRALPLFAILTVVQLCLLSMRGQSVGKLLLGLRIVRVHDGSAPGFVHAFLLRGTVPFVIERIPFFGFLFWIVDSCFIFSPDRRCLHDLIAGTRVVQGRPADDAPKP